MQVCVIKFRKIDVYSGFVLGRAHNDDGRPTCMNDDFAFRYVRIYPGINSRAELVTLPKARALLALGQMCDIISTFF